MPRSTFRSPSGALVVAAAALLGACSAVGPDYVPPEIETPASFTSAIEAGVTEESVDLAEWWKRLDDPTLDDLVRRALEHNLDLRGALARIREARAARGIVTPDLYPTVDVDGFYRNSQLSQESVNGAFLPRRVEEYSVGIGATWELDLWGRIRRSIEAADADIEVSVESARAVLVAVVAETALAYVRLRELQARFAIATDNIDIQEKTFEVTRARFASGLVSELDVAQAESILQDTRANLPPLRAAVRSAKNRLAVLIGESPGALEKELDPVRPIPVPAVEIAIGVPAELLRRRPDVRRSERALAAQTARVGVATGDLYPRFALSGTLGLEADDVASLFSRGAAGFSFGPSVAWNLFDRSRIHGNIDVQDARREQALLAYEQTVLIALEEAENAATNFVTDQVSRSSLDLAVERARRALAVSQDQYRRGLVGFQSVLDTQARLFSLEDTLAVAEASIVSNLIRLYLALGGGWECRDVVIVPRSEKEDAP